MMKTNQRSQRTTSSPYYKQGFAEAARQASLWDIPERSCNAINHALDCQLQARHVEKAPTFVDYFQGLIDGFSQIVESYAAGASQGIDWNQFKATAL